MEVNNSNLNPVEKVPTSSNKESESQVENIGKGNPITSPNSLSPQLDSSWNPNTLSGEKESTPITNNLSSIQPASQEQVKIKLEKEGVQQTANNKAFTELSIEEQKQPKKWFWPLIISGSIIFILAFLVFLNEKQIVYFGFEKVYSKIQLEKLWQGLSINPIKVLKQANVESAKNSSYQFSQLVKIDKIYENNDQLGTAGQNSATGMNFSTSTNITTQIIAPDKFYSKNEIQITSSNVQQTSDIEMVLSDMIYGRTTINNQISSWQSAKYDVSLNLSKEKIFKSANILDQFKEIENYIVNTQYLGLDKIDNKNTYHYNGKLKSEFFAVLIQANNSNFTNNEFISKISQTQLDIDYWIDKSSKRFEKITIQLSGYPLEESGYKSKINFSDQISFANYSQIDESSFPSLANATIITPQEFVPSYLTSEKEKISEANLQQLKQIRDLERKNDLKTIASALEKYKNEKGSYPVSQDITKSNQSVGPLVYLTPNYLDKLPVDPLDPQYYYGYTSDGKSYQLTSILENQSDSQGVKSGDVLIYTLKSQ